jgi:hypothetical protein
MANLADKPGQPLKAQNVEKRLLVAVATFTDGAGASTVTGDSDITLADGGTGTFDLTFPASPDADGFVGVTVVSASATISKAWLSAVDFRAGTATINTALNTAGTLVDPASGNQLLITIVAQPYTV